jgi:hypothetical protein
MDRAFDQGTPGVSNNINNAASEPTTAPSNEPDKVLGSKSLPKSLSAASSGAPGSSNHSVAYHLIRYKNGNQALQLDNGLELISLKDGTKIGRLPNGYRYIIQPDGSSTCIAPDGSVIAL